MSWPSCVVPSQCWLPGCASDAYWAASLGCFTDVNSRGTAAIAAKIKKMMRPAIALRFVRTAVQRPPPARRRAGSGAPVTMAVLARIALIGLRLRPCARVEPEGHKITDQDGDQHRDRDEHEECLQQRVVGIHRRVVEHVAEAGIVEHVFDENRTADHETQRHRKSREI